MPSRSSHRSPLFLEGRVRGLGRQGAGAVETAQGVVFVEGALPQEQVRLRLLPRRRGALHGELSKVLEPSPQRVEPPCQLSSRCGGCPWMNLAEEAQREVKRAWVEQAVRAFAEPGLVVEIEHSPTAFDYRRRARLAFTARGRKRCLGYRPGRSADVVDVAHCLVLDASLQRGLESARAHLLPVLEGDGELWLAHSTAEQPVVWLHARGPQPPAVYDGLRALVQDQVLAGAALRVGADGPVATFGEPRQAMIAADGQLLWGPPFSFSQSNGAVNTALAHWVRSMAQPAGQRVVELFCGHGNLTVLLASSASQYHALEADALSVAACRENLAARGITAAHLCVGDAAGYRGPVAADVVVLDPPRSGARDVMETIRRLSPRRVVYVSCDPATLRRDLSQLHGFGFGVEAARAFDMFPHTTHVEAAVLLSPQARAPAVGGGPGH